MTVRLFQPFIDLCTANEPEADHREAGNGRNTPIGRSIIQANINKNTFLTTTTQSSKALRVSWCLDALAVMGLMLSGCGGPHEKSWPTSGRVTFQGKPVAAGVIRFSNPQAGIDITAELGPDGVYKAVRAQGAGLPEGTYQVAVMPPVVHHPVGVERISKPPECRNIPAKYRQPSTSGLTLKVKPDVNPFDVDMQP
jgi:hypothetical protein